MAKLTKPELAAHSAAMALINSDKALSEDDVIDVIEGYHEGAVHNNAAASAIFSSFELARHAALEVSGPRILDLCAGIGTLSVAAALEMAPYRDFGETQRDFVLLEINPDYAKIAKRLMPNAEVIVGSVYDEVLIAELATRGFDSVISNPPFGNMTKRGQTLKAPRYTGGEAHYDIIDISSDLANRGIFILPASCLPFAYSGKPTYTKMANARYQRFFDLTDIELGPNLGIDTTMLKGFRGTNITVEITVADFEEARARRQAKIAPIQIEDAAPKPILDPLPLFASLAA